VSRAATASAPARFFAWLVIRLRWPIVLGWIAATIFVLVSLPTLEDAGTETSVIGLVPQDAAAIEAGVRSAELFSVPVIAHSAVVQRDPDGLSADAQRRVVERALAVRARQYPELLDLPFALPIVNVRGFVPGSRETATTAITFLFFPRDVSVFDQDKLSRWFVENHVRAPDDALVGRTGAVPARVAEWREIERSLPLVTGATVLAIALVLGLYFRSLVAPAVALAAAGIGYVVSLRTVGWLGQRFDISVPRDAEPVLVVLLLGMVTDYAVFFLSGMRERLLAGDRPLRAAEESTARFLPIVLTAGLIVAGGSAALVVGKLEFFRAFGPGMALTVLIGLAVAVTLVPALMAIVGRFLLWPSRAAAPDTRRRDRGHETERVSRVASFATFRPVALVIIALALTCLFFAARGLGETRLGFTQIRGLPSDSEPKRAAVAAGTGFAPGILAPTVLLVENVTADDLAALIRLERALEREPGVAGAIGPGNRSARAIPNLVLAREQTAARYLVVLDEEPQGAPAIAELERLRDRMPELAAAAGLEDARFRFAGDTALAAETVATVKRDLVRIGLAAFLVNLVLLVVFLRALLAPLYLVLSSLLVVAASLGLTTLVFQGFLGHGELTYYVPFAVAVLLLSLGSDYNVFLVGRIWQEARQRPLREAVAIAAPRASRAIGVAGVALALSFAALGLIGLRQFREFAFAMVVGVLLDAFLVRALLIPALVSFFGERSWWPWNRRPAEAPFA
jgi:putative drug exporter of the RND superfamily